MLKNDLNILTKLGELEELEIPTIPESKEELPFYLTPEFINNLMDKL